jgi:two-component system response regulator HydG
MSRILVIDDDAGVRHSIEQTLRHAGHAVQTAETGEEGLDLALGGAFDVILSDMRMPGISGIEVLRRLRERQVDSALIIMTGFGTIDSAVEAMKLGAVDFVQKPFFRDELLMRVRSAVERRQLARQVTLLARQLKPAGSLDALLGDSEAMARVRGQIARAAAAGGTVLITGETGTGKELAARAVHAESPRRTQPFVALNCAALAESLLETELFGHARGAFTGAAAARPGLLEHAHRGTLLLDEVGTMPAALQAKLLRVLEAGEVRRVGENDTRTVDVRFVAATNADLEAAIRAGAFRQDLFYRLNVHRIHLPALRERREDIPLLVTHFLNRYGEATGVRHIGAAALDRLGRHDFAGNVRELEHLIQRAVVIARDGTIEVADLPEELCQEATSPGGTPSTEGGVAAARDRAEREMIVSALSKNAGDLTAAARDIQVSRTTLWRLMKKHSIAVP